MTNNKGRKLKAFGFLSLLVIAILGSLEFTSVGLYLQSVMNPLPGRNDFDGDGLSDLADVHFDGANTIYYVRPSTNPYLLQVRPFPGAYDFHLSGNWHGDGKAYPAVARKSGANLEWTFKTPDVANDVKLTFGLAGDLVPNQGDLDCDGVTDIVTTRTKVPGQWERFRVWYIAPSSYGGTGIVETIFGLDTDKIGIADIDGDGCDEMVVLREPEFNWYTKKMDDVDANPTPVQWGLPGDIGLLPSDLDKDGLPDYTIVRPNGAKQTAYIRYSSKQAEVADLGNAGSVPFIGDFFGAGTQVGWVDRTAKTSYIKVGSDNFSFGWGTPVAGVLRPDGTYVGVGNDGSIGNFGSSTGGTTTQTTNIGRAAFAIMNKTFECDAFVNSMVNLPDWHVAILYDSFGNPVDGSGNPACVERLMNDPKLKSLEVHGINTVCYRNHNCQSYEFMSGVSNFDANLANNDPATVNRVRAYYKEQATFLSARLKPWTQCYFSVALEHDLKQPATTNLVAIARQELPFCKIVTNPNGGSSNQNISGADLLEKHTLNPSFGGVPGISNNDGADIEFPSSKSGYSKTVSEANYKKHLANATKSSQVVFVWMKEDNCRDDSGRDAPRARVCKNNGRYVLAANMIASVIPAAPSPQNPQQPPTNNTACNVNLPISDGGSKNFTYNPDNSRKKPKFILPKEFVDASNSGVLVTSGGNIPCTRAYPDEHSNGPRPRWYCEIAVTDTPRNVTFAVQRGGQTYCATIPDPSKRYD